MTEPPPLAYTIENRIYEHYYAQRSLETNYDKNALNVFAVVHNASKWTNHDVCDNPFRSSPLLSCLTIILTSADSCPQRC